MKDYHFKTIALIIVGALLIIHLFLGISYAYYLVETRGSSSTVLNSAAESAEGVKITNITNNLHIYLSSQDMSLNNLGDYYADEADNYVTSKSDGTHDIAKLTLKNENETLEYECTGNALVQFSISNDGEDISLEAGDLELYLQGGGLDKTIDLIDLNNIKQKEYKTTFRVSKNHEETLKAYVKLTNKNTNQNYLTDANININISLPENNFNCKVI